MLKNPTFECNWFHWLWVWISFLARNFSKRKNVVNMLLKPFWLFHSNVFSAHKVDHLCRGAGEAIKELLTAIPLHVMSSHYSCDRRKQSQLLEYFEYLLLFSSCSIHQKHASRYVISEWWICNNPKHISGNIFTFHVMQLTFHQNNLNHYILIYNIRFQSS